MTESVRSGLLTAAIVATLAGQTPSAQQGAAGAAAAADPRLAVIDMRFSFEGLLGFLAGAPGCPGRPAGTAVMTGQVAGNEHVGPDDDIEYRGVMQLDVDIDLCEAWRPPGSSEDQLCELTVRGGGPVNVLLSVYFDDRGGYVTATQATQAAGPFNASVAGTCGQDASIDERQAFPDNSMANVFNGADLPLKSGPLQKGTYRDGKLVVEVVNVVRRP